MHIYLRRQSPPALLHSHAADALGLYCDAGLPLFGWLLLSAAGKPIPEFGLHLPALVPVSEPLADWLKPRHTTCGTLGYYLIGLHTAAALWHHNWGQYPRQLLPRRASRALNVPDEPAHFAPVASPTNRQHKPKPHALERKPALGGPASRLLRRRGFV